MVPSIRPQVNALKPNPNQRRNFNDGKRIWTVEFSLDKSFSAIPFEVNDKQ